MTWQSSPPPPERAKRTPWACPAPGCPCGGVGGALLPTPNRGHMQRSRAHGRREEATDSDMSGVSDEEGPAPRRPSAADNRAVEATLLAHRRDASTSRRSSRSRHSHKDGTPVRGAHPHPARYLQSLPGCTG